MTVAGNEKQSLRVLFVISNLGLGGQEKRFVDVVLRFYKDPSIDPRVLVLQEGGEREAKLHEAGVSVTVVRRGWARIFRRNGEIWKQCRRWKPDIVYAFDPLAGFYTRIAGRVAFAPVILSGFNSSRLLRRVKYAEQWLWRFVDKIVCNSEAGRSYLMQVCHIPSERIVVIPNGFDEQRMARGLADVASLREELGLSKDQPFIGMIGRLAWIKAPLTFAQAAAIVHAKYPDVAFCIIGSGPELPAVRKFLDERQLEGCFFLIPQRSDAPWLARDFDIGVLSSRGEGLPNVVLEYMYWRKPCVVTDVGDCNRVVEHGQTGLVVPPQDPEAMATALFELLDDPRSAEQMGKRGRARLDDHYRIERYMDDLRQLLHSLYKKG